MPVSKDRNGDILQGSLKLGTTQKLSVGGSATDSVAINAPMFQICGTAPFHLKIGTGATTNDAYIPANVVIERGIVWGGTISVIQADYAGFVTVTELR